MARFLITYHGAGMPQDPETMAQVRQAFGEWATKTGTALAEPGAPIKFSKTLSDAGLIDGEANDPMTGWSVLEASDAETAAKLLKDHPFIARGGLLQISAPVEI